MKQLERRTSRPIPQGEADQTDPSLKAKGFGLFKKRGDEPTLKPFYMTVTPPTGSSWVGIRHAASPENVLQAYLRETGLSRREIAGRVCLTLLRPPKGKEYHDVDLTITRKSKEDFLRECLVSVC